MNKKAIVLLGHGSRLPYQKDLIMDMARQLESKDSWDIVTYGFMEMNKPSIIEAIDGACADGAVSIVLAPVFIAKGAHILEDIPSLVGFEPGTTHFSKEWAGAKRDFFYSETIGSDPKLVEIIEEKARVAMQ